MLACALLSLPVILPNNDHSMFSSTSRIWIIYANAWNFSSEIQMASIKVIARSGRAALLYHRQSIIKLYNNTRSKI